MGDVYRNFFCPWCDIPVQQLADGSYVCRKCGATSHIVDTGISQGIEWVKGQKQ